MHFCLFPNIFDTENTFAYFQVVLIIKIFKILKFFKKCGPPGEEVGARLNGLHTDVFRLFPDGSPHERWFCASSLPNSRVAVAQLHIAKALYNQSMTLSVLHEPNTHPRYLQKAAWLLFDWVAACPTEAAELQKRNEVPVVLMLCGSARSMS